jgi:hypothetical protein
MRRYALVNEAGETANVIVWDGVTAYTPPDGLKAVPEEEAAPYLGPPVPIPERVTNFQARAALRRMGLLDIVHTMVQQEGGEAWDAWEYANHVYRNGALVVAMSQSLGLTPKMVDDLFIMADQIEA